ncbi:HAMP domain-containing histidine kinase [Cyanobacterium stanieri LEGE 03274]|uniref:histidine kinase n=1 Tax=Cyanobacterium stanieri LEGE 03274 TaxID=1828756 RepID=A0ABR9V644_9CHRO|nr:HAMP domain-containing sensor histidine kinase [Cyanobacterium stanieri]MBE9223365.1 HAMP domain-containing histidine kinase [Cyanobacterium stanieri LEGE 03274]
MQPPYTDLNQLQNHLFSALENDEPQILYQKIYHLIAEQYSPEKFIITHCYQIDGLYHHELVYSINIDGHQENSKIIIDKFNQLTNLNQLITENIDNKLLWQNNLYFDIQHPCKLSIFPILYRHKIIGTLSLDLSTKQLEKINNNQLISIISQNLALLFVNLDTKKKQLKLNEEKENQKKYLSTINHEIRAPIASVIGFSKMLKQQIYGELNSKQLQYVNAIYESGNYLLELVIDLLDLAKLEAQKEELYLEKVFIKKICQSCLSFVHVKTFHKNLELQLIIKSAINYIYADERKIKQILINLLSNAVKFTEKGSVTLKVCVENSQIKFSVIDTGIGIKPEDYHKLFKPFSQIQNCPHNQEKGTGLGLVISQELAKLHGGDITFESEIGKGSCFTLSLPMN